MFGLHSVLESAIFALIGVIVGYLANYVYSIGKANSARDKADKLLAEAKSNAQDILLDSKNKALNVLEDAKREEQERNKQLTRIESLLLKKEKELDTQSAEIASRKENLLKSEDHVNKIKEDLEKRREKQIEELQKVANLTIDQAKEQLFATLEKQYQDDLYHRTIKLEQQGREEIDRKAKELLTLAIQRYAGSHVADVTTTVVTLPSDEIKGKIIGKEGRNIKAIERLTGVDVIIDDTPEALIISGFDPVRRQIAKNAIDKLILDGRIHPAKIEEMVEKAREEINEKIQQAGEAALFEVGVGAMETKLTFLLGRLAFRTSFGQNVLIHSIEMAHIAGILASELGADVMVAKKGALFHDIGKAVDHEVQGTHVEIGRKLLQKFNVDEAIVKAMEAHHEEYPYSSLESRIVQASDAISGARPGARRDTVEAYIKRLEDLERIANSFDGIEKSYAVQAGREMRIFVSPTKVDDLSALKLARDIAEKIQNEMKYPGEIKVNVIRETRAIEYAR